MLAGYGWGALVVWLGASTPLASSDASPAVGVQLAGAVMGGVAPGDPALEGGHLALAILHRWSPGMTLAADVRWLGIQRYRVFVHRLQIAVGGGYVWQREHFELETRAGLTLEPWWFDNTTGAHVRAVGRTPNRLGIGAMVRVAPGWRFMTRPKWSGRLGVFGVMAASVATNGARVATVEVDDAGGTRYVVTRVGGLELGGGVDFTLWFRLSPRH